MSSLCCRASSVHAAIIDYPPTRWPQSSAVASSVHAAVIDYPPTRWPQSSAVASSGLPADRDRQDIHRRRRHVQLLPLVPRRPGAGQKRWRTTICITSLVPHQWDQRDEAALSTPPHTPSLWLRGLEHCLHALRRRRHVHLLPLVPRRPGAAEMRCATKEMACKVDVGGRLMRSQRDGVQRDGTQVGFISLVPR